MTALVKNNSLDLNISVPRSSKETMAGIAHLPRMIDKARALRNGTLGEYIYPCPLDHQILNFLEEDPEEFADRAEFYADEEMTEWAQAISASKSSQDRDLVNVNILEEKPNSRNMDYFLEMRNEIDPTPTDIKTWVDLIDLEEGHI